MILVHLDHNSITSSVGAHSDTHKCKFGSSLERAKLVLFASPVCDLVFRSGYEMAISNALAFRNSGKGWHPTASGNMSQTLYYCSLLVERDQDVPTIFWGGPLFQEFLCDAWGESEIDSVPRWL